MASLTPEQTSVITSVEKYVASTSAGNLTKITDYLRIALPINPEILDFVKAYLQVQIEKFSQESSNDASKRFAYYDVLVDLSKNFGVLKILTPESLKLILSEISVHNFLETATAIQVIFELCDIPDFDKVKEGSHEATKLLEELFLKMIKAFELGPENCDEEDQVFIEDDTFLISITKLVTIFNPKLLLKINKFESFSSNFVKVYLESLAFITKQAKFDQHNVNLTENIVSLISDNVNSINQNDQFFGLQACEHLSVHDFEKVKNRVFELAAFPDHKIRLQCLKVFATRAGYLEGCKSAMRISGFLDWLLVKNSETEKECMEVKFDIVSHVEKFARNELKLHSKIQLELKRYVKDGAFYDSKMPELSVMTEEA